MNGKQSKKLKRVAKMMAIGKSESEQNKIYNRLKQIHTKTKGK